VGEDEVLDVADSQRLVLGRRVQAVSHGCEQIFPQMDWNGFLETMRSQAVRNSSAATART